MQGRLHITELTEEGMPVAPEHVARKYVSQTEAIIRDNVPISIRECKGKRNDLYAAPDIQKDMMWANIKKHFTFPKGYVEKDVKAWMLKKMVTEFQTFKKMLDANFIEKGRTPGFDEWPKLRDHWKSFVEYKMSEGGASKVRINVANASKEYHHHLGRGGYSTAIPRWRNMEQDLIDRGIVPATLDWPDRLKNWYYAHEGNLSQEDATLVFNKTIR